jgi:MFS family permease
MRLPRIVIVVMSAAVVVITSISMNAFSLFLTPIEEAFGWSRTTATVPYVFAMLGWAAGGVLFGKKADDLGTRPVILGGVVLMAAGFFGMGLSQNLWQLSLTFGIMTGMAKGACGLVIISLLVAKHYDAANRGLAVSIVQTASPMSPFFLAWPLHFIIVNYDWRMAAMFCGVLLLGVAFPFGWIGARDPDPTSSTRREAATWSSCLPYLRDRSMLLLFAARFSCGFALFQSVHLVAIALSKGFDQVVGRDAVTVFGVAAAVSAVAFGWVSDRYGRAHALALTYVFRGVGTLVMSLDFSNPLAFYIVVALAMGPTFGTIGVQNVMFFEMVGPRLAGLILGLSFLVHQVGSSGGPILASVYFDVYGSYDGFLQMMSLILLASAAMVYITIRSDDAPVPEPARP